jgi:hypothetical protein
MSWDGFPKSGQEKPAGRAGATAFTNEGSASSLISARAIGRRAATSQIVVDDERAHIGLIGRRERHGQVAACSLFRDGRP